MIIIDWDKTKEAIASTIAHHGTRTQGEEVRQGQVVDKICQMTIDLIDAYTALCNLDECDTTISIFVKH